MSSNNTPVSVTAADVAVPSEPRHPVDVACGRVFDAFKGGNACEVLQAFDELLALGVEDCPNLQPEIMCAWGRGLLSAMQMCSDDEEHLAEMVEDFETRFSCSAPYLRVMLVDGETVMDSVRMFLGSNPAPEVETALPRHHRSLVSAGGIEDELAHIPPLIPEVPVAGDREQYILDVVDGVTEKFRNFSCTDAKDIVAWLEEIKVLPFLPNRLAEKLQRPFIARMKSKSEDVETVFEEMLSAHLKPVSPIPFTFIFMKTELRKPVVEYYYMLMLSFGIKAVDSVYRLLMRHSGSLSKEDFVFIKRRMLRVAESDVWYEKKLDQLRSIAEDESVQEEASKLFRCMLLDGVVPSRHAFNKIIAMSKGSPTLAEAWYRKMLDMGVTPNALTFIYLSNVWKPFKPAHDAVERWIGELQGRGMQLDSATYISLLEGYVKSNSRNRAQNCFKSLLARGECTVHVYNITMSLGPFDFAFGCLAAMLSDGFEPDAQTKEALLAQTKDDVSNIIVDAIDSFGWSRMAMLTNPTLVAPPKGSTPSLHDCMRLMMREMKMSDEDIKQRTEMLTAELDLAKRS
eukprot:CAMPEP_0176450828 /NCGR_PEP_ID=MMETSP0127-20121128/27407_1 /TAXON_ID=938130 /ORGANISM="Platyophrya macrostoma, Strain WH" /LENGTH=570 /DNA_ID=CAMNT_0017838635 /DNA_START=1 /DNA_END=1713 /DNA_ORIENTATION=+